MGGKSPYEGLPPGRYWRTGVAEQPTGQISGIYSGRFPIPKDAPVATAGSCFAQHIAINLRKRGWFVLDVEPAPPSMSDDKAKAFGYRLYSARYANIYTARQLVQLAEESLSGKALADPVWENEGRFFDAFRPSVEPEGLGSRSDVFAHREHHLTRFRVLLKQADFWVFTLGLTEAWVDTANGAVFPTAPGTIAGVYDSSRYKFHNFGVSDVIEDFARFRAVVHEHNANARFLLTVSPVPLTATASGQHVLPATIYSKSVLRAAAGALYDAFEDVDYFPSYELIGTPFTGSIWFEPNRRSVRADGVEMVMRHFFAEHGEEITQAAPSKPIGKTADEVVCEDALLEAFSQ